MALLIVIVFLFSSSVYATNQFQIRKNARAMLDAARSTLQEGNHKESVSLYLRYLNFQPRDVDALSEYAGLLENQLRSQPKLARELADTYDRILNVDSSRNDDRRKLVKLYLDAHYYIGAKGHLDYLLDPSRGREVDDPELLEQYAICEQKLGRTSEAIERLRQAVSTRKAGPDAYLRLANLLRNDMASKSAHEEADRMVDQLREDRPTDTSARIGRAQYFFRQGRRNDGRAELEAAARQLKDAATNVELVILLAETYLQDDNPTAARDLLTRALEVNPNQPLLHVLKSESLARLNDPSRSDEELRIAMKQTPDTDPRGLDLVDWMIDRRDYATAKREADRRFAVRREEFEPVYHYLTGRLKLAEGDWPAALKELQAARSAFARIPRYHAKLLVCQGDAYLAGNNPDQAAELYHEAILRYPAATDAELKLAEVQVRLGRTVEATETFRKYADTSTRARIMWLRQLFAVQMSRPSQQRDWSALEIAAAKAASSPEVDLIRAAVLDAQGKLEDASKLLNASIQRHPEDRTLQLALAGLAGRKDPTAGATIIDEAIKKLGDHSVFRLAKMGYLARAGADLASIEAQGSNAAGFPKEDQYALYLGLGELLLMGLQKPSESVPWLRLAADLERYDVKSRSYLIEAFIQTKQDAEADKIIAELAPLEGPNGPHALFARAIRTISSIQPNERAKYEQAREQLEQVITSRESWTKPYVLLGQLAEKMGVPDVAIDRYRKAFELGERTDAVTRSLVNLLMNRGRFPEAMRILEEREKMGRLSGEERQQLVYAELLSGRKIEQGAEAVKLAEASKDPRDQLFRGRVLLLENQVSAAITAFEKATSYGPRFPEGWVELVNAYRLAGNDQAAKAAAQKAAQNLTSAKNSLSPAEVHLTLGRIHFLLNDTAKAEQEFRRAQKESPDEPEPTIQLAILYRSMGRSSEADRECQAIVSSQAANPVRRWARRTLAYSLLARPDGFRKLPEALALIEENLKEGDSAEDKRAKAIVLSVDPLRRAETKRLLDLSKSVPATPEESVRIGLLFEQEGDLDRAEEALREATRGPIASPEHLEILFRIQFARGRSGQETLDRLKTIAPNSWSACAAEARQLAKRDQLAAVRRLSSFNPGNDPAIQLRLIVPLLIDMGCKIEAEKLLKDIAEKSNLPQRKYPYLMNLARNGKWRLAYEQIRDLPANEYPANIRARLYRDTFGSTPRAIVPPAERDAWDKAAGEAVTWVKKQISQSPTDALYPTVAGVIMDAQGRYDESIKAFEQSLKIAPDQADVRNNLALLLLYTNAGPVAPLELVTRAIEFTGPTPYLLDTRAVILIAAGKPEEAIQDLTAALLVVQKPVYYFHIALAYEKSGNVGLKIEFIDRAVQKGLKRNQLHPKEWPDYDRLFGPES